MYICLLYQTPEKLLWIRVFAILKAVGTSCLSEENFGLTASSVASPATFKKRISATVRNRRFTILEISLLQKSK